MGKEIFYLKQMKKKGRKNLLDNGDYFWQGVGNITLSGSSAPDSSGFFVPTWADMAPIWRVNRAEYKTRKGNKLSRLSAVVETRRLINAAKSLNTQEVYHVC